MNNHEQQTVTPAPIPLLTFRCPRCRTKWLMPGAASLKSHICKICGHHFEIEPMTGEDMLTSSDQRGDRLARRL